MPPLVTALLIAGAFAAGIWLTMVGAILCGDALAAFEVGDQHEGMIAARQGIVGAGIGLVIFTSAANVATRMLL